MSQQEQTFENLKSKDDRNDFSDKKQTQEDSTNQSDLDQSNSKQFSCCQITTKQLKCSSIDSSQGKNKSQLNHLNKKTSRLRRHSSLMSGYQRRRFSNFDQNFCHHRNLQNDQKSTEFPSTASDSAFSQSQTTLESDSSGDQTNCQFGIKKDSNHFLSDTKKLIHLNDNHCGSRSTNSEPNSSSSASSLQDDDDPNQFKIIWQNLSYRVPEKRFAKSYAWLQNKFDKVWPARRQDDIPNETSIIDEQIVNSEQLNEPPMRAPISGKPRKVIFSNLNGCVKSGQLTAILGPSGAGKTTFLKCLTNNIVKGVSGSIDITGAQATSRQHLKLCIIPQKDYLFDNLTVMENLIFASRIKNTKANFNHKENVERVANLLGLSPCLKLKTNRLSGGQYKRVSIAQELLSKPDILILDEPTSGLDSLTCYRTVSVLRDLVNLSRAGLMSPLAIIMTIHQPQIKIFNLFHHVYILSSMGKCVYEGQPDYLIDTVEACCKILPPSDDLNPASFIIDLASEVYGPKPIEKLSKLQQDNSKLMIECELNGSAANKSKIKSLIDIQFFVDTDSSSSYNETSSATKTNINNLKYDTEDPQEINEIADSNEVKISDRLKKRNNHDENFWLHTSLLINRLWVSMWRDPLLTTTRITFHLIIPFVFYVIYSQKSGAANACPHLEREFDFQTMTSEESTKRLAMQHNELILTFENVSLFFLLLYSFSMCVLAVTALSFPLNMQILLKEIGNGWYSMPRFVMAKTLADLPIELTMPIISVAMAYVLTGQPSSYFCWRMLTVTAVMTLCSLISQTQGLLFGAYFMNNVQAAVFVSQASSLPWILLSGFTTRVSELPKLLQWFSYGSIYRLGIESIVAVRYGFGMCPCDQELVNKPSKIVGIPEQLKSVIRYYLDYYTEQSPNNNSSNISNEDNFENIASSLSRANTYGIDIMTCHDVRPFILSAREVDEGTLPAFLLILVLIFIVLKVLLFCVVRLRVS